MVMKLQDLLKDIELGKVYTDKDKPPFKVNEDHKGESRMAKSDLFKMSQYSKTIHDMIDDDMDLPEWVESKLTKASDYLGSVKHYLEYEMKRGEKFTEDKISEKVNQSKVNQAFTRGVAAIRKISRSLSDDDNYAFIQKLEKWLK
jgi:hypothetical protein|tara:strand:- start:854 stop:1288 length:435 start_codon:yes stop_codon:yes gene_type:complete